MYEKISPARAARLLAEGAALAIDVREPDEYAAGHIPGAKNLPLGEVARGAARVMPDKGAVWIVYCRSGRRSAEAARELAALGYKNILDMGGILSWTGETEH